MEGSKVMLIGGRSVGKTSLRIVFKEGIFIEPSKYDPVIENTSAYQRIVDEKPTLVDIIDIDSFNFEAMKELCFKSADGFLLVYSITSKESFYELRKIYNEIFQFRKENFKNNENNENNDENIKDEIKDKLKFPLVIVGNKKDLETKREVSEEEGRELAKEFNCPFIEVSSMDVPLATQSLFLVIREIRKFFPPLLNHPHHKSKCFIV